MPSQFPGMDPYLESPRWFPGLHDRMIPILGEFLQSRLPAPYFAEIGRRLWVEVSRRAVGPDVFVLKGRRKPGKAPKETAETTTATLSRSRPVLVTVPQDERREIFLEIRIRGEGGERVVASIEVLSSSNKTPSEHGREFYLRKQTELIDSTTHLIEIDLLRAGEHTVAVPREFIIGEAGPFDYVVSVHRFDQFEDFEVYPIQLEDRLPEIAFPLLPGDPDVLIDLQTVFDRCYDTGPYRLHVDYESAEIVPPLSAERTIWARKIVEGSEELPTTR